MFRPVLGIIGGGQLGSLLASAAKVLILKLLYYVMIVMRQQNILQMSLYMENIMMKIP